MKPRPDPDPHFMKTGLRNSMARSEFRDRLRHKRTRQGRFEDRFVHRWWDQSDEGAGARRIYDGIELPDSALPLWLKLWRQRRKQLRGKRLKVHDALLQDLRPAVAARIAGVGRDLVYDCLRKIFKVHFAQCFQAWKRDSGS